MREYFSTANAIDIHNQYGQSLLAIEKIWKVAVWWKRLFQFIVRVSVVDSYLACRYFQDKPDTFLMDFVDDLASELCWPKRQSPSPKRRKSIEWQASSKVCSMESVKEMFPSINSKGSGRCKVVGPNGQPCGAEAYYFCRKCSVFRDEQKPKVFLRVWGPYCKTVWLQASTIFNSTECSGGVTSSFDLLLLCFMLFIVGFIFSLHIYMLFLSTDQNTQFSFPDLFT